MNRWMNEYMLLCASSKSNEEKLDPILNEQIVLQKTVKIEKDLVKELHHQKVYSYQDTIKLQSSRQYGTGTKTEI